MVECDGDDDGGSVFLEYGEVRTLVGDFFGLLS